MIHTLYIEEEVAKHPTTERIVAKFPNTRVVYCERFSEIFNRNAQCFRLQKEFPSLILAKKYGNYLQHLQEPSLGRKNNYYFSPFLNCLYDCTYCFLQGIYRSSFLTLFVNFEDFKTALCEKMQKEKDTCFFAGYDGDSLALDELFGFIPSFIPFFKEHKDALFELRTKSNNISPLLSFEPLNNVVIAFSLNPAIVIDSFEKKTPALHERIQAIKTLQEKGWNVGLRFDPVLYHKGFEGTYGSFFHELFSMIDRKIHSTTVGSVRFPRPFFERMKKSATLSPLFAHLQEKNGLFVHEKEKDILDFCEEILSQYIPKETLYLHNHNQ